MISEGNRVALLVEGVTTLVGFILDALTTAVFIIIDPVDSGGVNGLLLVHIL